MVLEEEIPAFSAWIVSALAQYFFTALLVILSVGAVVWLVLSVLNGPLVAGDRIYRGLLLGIGDLAGMSVRRIGALTWLAVRESFRRHVLVVLPLFALIVLFAGWFLDPASTNPGKLYIGFITGSTTILVSLVVLVLSVFSLPSDIKSKAIQTVTTKPVRTCEIVLSRILGFAAVGTLLLAIMGTAGWVFVVRSVNHRHTITPDDLVEIRGEDGAVVSREGRTSVGHKHRHRVVLAADGRDDFTEYEQGHRHRIRPTVSDEVTTYEIGPPEGILKARRPLRGTLRFLDREGRPSTKGISVGAEWSYRQFVEGGSLAAAIWTFTGIREQRFPKGLPLEMSVRVYRTYVGNIEKGITGTVRLRNPVSGLQSDPFYFTAKEFTIDALLIPRKIAVTSADGGTRQVDLFDDIVTDGQVEVVLQCLEPAQYFGVARADFYLLEGEGWFAVNYFKTCLGIWFTMLLVTAMGVAFSTFLAGPVALFATLAVVLVGQFHEFIGQLFESQMVGDFSVIPGGGPIESLVRIATQESITLEWESTPTAQFIKTIDTCLLAPMKLATALVPSLRTLGTSNFLAGGFDVPLNLLAQHGMVTLGYLIAFFVAGAMCLRAREVAAS